MSTAHTVRLYKIDTQIRNWKKYIILVAVASTHCNQTIHFHASLSLMHFNYTWCCWASIECNRTHQLRTECKRILHLSATSDSATSSTNTTHTQFQRTTTLGIYMHTHRCLSLCFDKQRTLVVGATSLPSRQFFNRCLCWSPSISWHRNQSFRNIYLFQRPDAQYLAVSRGFFTIKLW